jgi:hypothetical protein
MGNTVTLKSTPALFYFVAVAALIAEVAALVLVGLDAGIWLALSLHALAIALVLAWSSFSRKQNYNERFGSFLLPMTITAGPFGVIICLIASLTYALCAARAPTPSEWIESLFEREADSESTRISERILLGLDDHEEAEKVEPFRDILTGGTVLQKQMATAKIARYFRPQFAPLLLQAAKDSNAAVRVQAATALAKIERDFMMRYIKLENTLKQLSNNNPLKIALAELYDDYAYTGLLDENNRQSLREKAIDIYKACLATRDNQDWRIRLARLYLRQEQPQEACDCLAPLVKSPQVSQRAVHWYMEALFRLKQYDDLRAIAGTAASYAKQTSDDVTFDETTSVFVWRDLDPVPAVA